MSRESRLGIALLGSAGVLGVLGDFLFQGQLLGLNVAVWMLVEAKRLGLTDAELRQRYDPPLTQADLKGNDTDVDNTNAELSVTAVSGATKSTLTRRAARSNSASIETSIPGARTPPTYSPEGETTSKFVEVPKSTTIEGAP